MSADERLGTPPRSRVSEPATPSPDRNRPGLRRLPRSPIGGHLLVLALLWATPVAVAVALQGPARQAQAEVLDPPAPQLATVGSREQTLRRLVRVDVLLGTRPQVAVGGGGLVTGLRIRVGDTIANGSPLAEVDGVEVLANRGERPFYRDLAQGSRGQDATQLNTLLIDLGLPAEQGSDKVTAATVRGIRSLQKQIGAPQDGTFRPGYAWFVPADFTVVDQVQVATGDLAAAGEAALTSARTALGATVVSQDEPGGLRDLADQPVRLVIGDQTLDIPGLQLDAAATEEVRQALTAAGRGPAPDAAEGSTQTFADLGLELRLAPKLGTVPRSALLTGPSGTVCVFVWTAAPDGASESVEAVTLPAGMGTGFEISSALVPPDLIGRDVVIDPTALRATDRARCA